MFKKSPSNQDPLNLKYLRRHLKVLEDIKKISITTPILYHLKCSLINHLQKHILIQQPKL